MPNWYCKDCGWFPHKDDGWIGPLPTGYVSHNCKKDETKMNPTELDPIPQTTSTHNTATYYVLPPVGFSEYQRAHYYFSIWTEEHGANDFGRYDAFLSGFCIGRDAKTKEQNEPK